MLASAWSVICIGLLCFRLFGRCSSMDRGVRPWLDLRLKVCVIMPSCWIRWCDAEFRTDQRALSGAARNKSKSQHSVQRRLNSLQLVQQQSMRLACTRARWGQLLRSLPGVFVVRTIFLWRVSFQTMSFVWNEWGDQCYCCSNYIYL